MVNSVSLPAFDLFDGNFITNFLPVLEFMLVVSKGSGGITIFSMIFQAYIILYLSRRRSIE